MSNPEAHTQTPTFSQTPTFKYNINFYLLSYHYPYKNACGALQRHISYSQTSIVNPQRRTLKFSPLSNAFKCPCTKRLDPPFYFLFCHHLVVLSQPSIYAQMPIYQPLPYAAPTSTSLIFTLGTIFLTFSSFSYSATFFCLLTQKH